MSTKIPIEEPVILSVVIPLSMKNKLMEVGREEGHTSLSGVVRKALIHFLKEGENA